MHAFWIVALFLSIAPPATFAATSPDQFAGTWAGAMDVGGGHKLRFILHLVNANGAWSGTADSPDQGSSGTPISKVTVDGRKLSFEIPEVDGEYEGTLDKDGKTIMGTWWQNGAALTLNLERDDDGTIHRPQEPKPSLPYRAGDVRFAGDWAGAVDAGGQKLRLLVHLVNASGAWSGSMDSLDQGANGIPFSLVTVDGARVHLEIAAIGGSYDGTLSDDGATILGTWKQSGASLTLDLARGDAASIPGPKRPQEPKPPFPYRAEDVAIPGPGGITLAGTLTLPQGTGPFPAVVLISGSGAQDRDELVFNHRPFLVLADYLTRHGLAVLRVDDRGTGKSTGHFATATTEDFAQDVTAEVAFIRARKDIDGKRIGLAGHSEGGIIAPMVASRSGDVSFIVLMAGVGVPMEHLIVRQLSQILKASGAGDEVIAFNEKAMGRMCAIAKADQDSILVRARLELAADSLSTEFAAMDSSQAAVGRQMLNRGIDMVSSRWFRYLLRLDFTAALKKVRVPVLAINGSLDIQVDPKENLPAIEKALRGGGNKDVTIREMPGLNHLFQTATTGSPMEYATIEETMSPEAMKVVSDWIAARTSAKKK